MARPTITELDLRVFVQPSSSWPGLSRPPTPSCSDDQPAPSFDDTAHGNERNKPWMAGTTGHDEEWAFPLRERWTVDGDDEHGAGAELGDGRHAPARS